MQVFNRRHGLASDVIRGLNAWRSPSGRQEPGAYSWAIITPRRFAAMLPLLLGSRARARLLNRARLTQEA